MASKSCRCEPYKLSKAKRLLMANGYRFSKWDVRCYNYPDVHGERVRKAHSDGQGMPNKRRATARANEMMASRCPMPKKNRAKRWRRSLREGYWAGE